MLGCKPICVDPTICGTTEAPAKKGTTTSGIGIKLVTSTTPVPYKCGFYVPPNYPVSPSYQQACRSGYYCPAGATPYTPIVPKKCPPGHYCGQKTCTPIECSCGYKCPAGSSAPIASEPPFYIPERGAVNQTVCPIGYKCDQRAMCNATRCPNGTYVSCAGKKSCDPCPAGRYCPVVTKSVLCPAGYSCGPGSSSPTRCPSNYYCPLGSSKAVACPGQKKSGPGAKSSASCT